MGFYGVKQYIGKEPPKITVKPPKAIIQNYDKKQNVQNVQKIIPQGCLYSRLLQPIIQDIGTQMLHFWSYSNHVLNTQFKWLVRKTKELTFISFFGSLEGFQNNFLQKAANMRSNFVQNYNFADRSILCICGTTILSTFFVTRKIKKALLLSTISYFALVWCLTPEIILNYFKKIFL